MGISVKLGYYGLDMSDWDFDLNDLPDADVTSYNSTTIKGYVGGFNVTIRGVGFTFDYKGIPGGTITGFSENYAGSNVVSVTGLKLSVSTVLDLANRGSLSQAAKIYKAQFGGDDLISGSKYADVLVGYDGNDRLVGNAGDDTIYGGKGNDKITGGLGADALHGEAGKDTFIFTSVSQSKAGSFDTIFDFNGKTGDRIDLSAIDADVKAKGNQDFEFIGSKKFSGDAGELRVVKDKSGTFVYGDTNGDKIADLVIHLDDSMVLTKGFFLL